VAIPDGFHVVGGKADRLARWKERKAERAVDELLTRLDRAARNRGVCRYCSREIGLIPGPLGSVTRYHQDRAERPCVGRGRLAA
jgi:hypothetical protein